MRQSQGAVLRHLDGLFRSGTAAGSTDAQLLQRFAGGRDEGSFAALVERHGPMVFSVCRGVLRSSHDAEDAFQATFLILAQKADVLRVGDSLGGWLHQVARRVAARASIQDARRSVRERDAAVAEATLPEDPGRNELLAIVHEEIGRLPEKYRAPIVLCELESLTRDQAAGQLGWPPGTVAGRLARGRDVLRGRLERRGIAPAGALAAGLLAAREAAAALPQTWPENVVAAAKTIALGRVVAAGTVSAAALALVEGVRLAMLRSMIRRVALAVVVTLALAAALVWAAQGEETTVTISGTVVGPDGQAAAGVSVLGSYRPDGLGWGHVVDETRTDGEGRFRLRLPASRDGRSTQPGALWAYQPGKLLGIVEARPGMLSPDVPVRLALGPPARTSFLVRGPDGKPVAGAQIRPRVLSQGFSVPDGLTERIGAETITDASGRAVMTALLPDDVATVFVVARGLGMEQFGFGHRNIELGTKAIDLLPVGRVEGRLIGEPDEVRGRQLTVGTSSETHPSPFPGLFYVTTNELGRFEVPAIAAGRLMVTDTRLDPKAPRSVRLPRGTSVEPGKTTEVELPLVKAVRVRGLVRERGTGKPLAGVEIGLNQSGLSMATGADGHYEGNAPPGGVALSLGRHDGFARLMYGGPRVAIPEGASEFELPTIELTRAGTVTGVVVDSQGRPVPGARVDAVWPVDEGENLKGPDARTVGTDGHGEFRLEGVPRGAVVTMTAQGLGARTAAAVNARVGDPSPARLQLVNSQPVALEGRVVGPGGKPVAGARVHLRRETPRSGRPTDMASPVDFDGVRILITDTEGRYRTPRRLDPESGYAAYAWTDGLGHGRTPFVSGRAGRIPDLILAPAATPLAFGTATLSGRVLDRQGKPIADVLVRSTSQVAGSRGGTTRPDGRFELEGTDPVRAIVLAEAPGYWTHGRIVDPGTPADLVLARSNELPTTRRRTLPPPLPRAERLALARGLLGPPAEGVLDKGNEQGRFRVLTALAECDPVRVLDALKQGQLAGVSADTLRRHAAMALLAEAPEKALTAIESIGDPHARSSAWREAAALLPAADRAGKLRLLDRALASAREAANPIFEMPTLGAIAESWLDLGEVDRATNLFRETLKEVQRLPAKAAGAYARAAFARRLARLDPEAALGLIAGIEDADAVLDRYRLNLAEGVASRDPAAAERLLDQLKQPARLLPNLPQIMHAMALKDPKRARRLVDRAGGLNDERSPEPFARAHALALMALALADADQPAAAELLAGSFAELKRLAVESPRDTTQMQDAASIAAALLPVVERVEPARVSESLWRAVSFRGRQSPRAGSAVPDMTLALFLARYDREAALVLLEPAMARETTGELGVYRQALWALAAIDPRRAVALVESMPDDPDLGLRAARNPKNLARVILAEALSIPADRWWDEAALRWLNLWAVGREEFR